MMITYMGTNLDYTLIVDSSYLISLSHEKDALYKKAGTIAANLSSETTIVLPAEIFSETINAIWRKVSKPLALEIAQSILSSNAYTFLETTGEIRSSALEKFKRQPNSVSFTDCLVMAFADELKTKYILGFDETFTKNGYTLP